MQDIEKLRAEIDQIHNELAALFRKRLELTHQVWEIKKAKQLPFFDAEREEMIIHQQDANIADAQEKIAVQNFFKTILSESKKVLESRHK